MARPSKYSEELVNKICERIADGESLRAICREDGMPTTSTIMLWLKDKPEFSEQYAHARVIGADAFEDQILMDAITTDKDNANAVKVKADILFKLMALRNPKKYNSKVDLTSSDGTMSPDKNIRVTFVKAKSAHSDENKSE